MYNTYRVYLPISVSNETRHADMSSTPESAKKAQLDMISKLFDPPVEDCDIEMLREQLTEARNDRKYAEDNMTNAWHERGEAEGKLLDALNAQNRAEEQLVEMKRQRDHFVAVLRENDIINTCKDCGIKWNHGIGPELCMECLVPYCATHGPCWCTRRRKRTRSVRLLNNVQ